MPTTNTPAKKYGVSRTAPRHGPQRDFAAMEERRMRAADLFAKGVSQADIARELGVVHQTVSDWHEKWQSGGKKALRGAGRAGRPPKVTDADLAKVEKALRKGPRANGYPAELWTLARVAEVIEEVTGVNTTPVTSGGCYATWDGTVSVRPAKRPSATTKPSNNGSTNAGPG